MKNYSLRSSTVKKTEATNERLRIRREIKKSKRTSNLLRKLCSREEIYLFDSALELANLPAENYETVEPNQAQEQANIVGRSNSENSDLSWDHSGDIESPIKELSIEPGQ